MTFWLNGEWREDPVAIRIDDRGFLLGDGVFETILVRNGTPAFLRRHLQRLAIGLEELSINAPLPDDFFAIARELAERNGMKRGDAVLRVTITRGAGARGLSIANVSEATMLMTLNKAAAAPTGERRLIVSNRVRVGSGAGALCKVPAYVENILALNDAIAAGAEDAVMLNANGNVVSATAANIFVIQEDGSAATPPLADGALPGVVRSVLLEQSAAHIEERSLLPDELRCGAVFLTNSLIGLAPVRIETSGDASSNALFNRLDTCYQVALAEDLRRAGAA